MATCSCKFSLHCNCSNAFLGDLIRQNKEAMHIAKFDEKKNTVTTAIFFFAKANQNKQSKESNYNFYFRIKLAPRQNNELIN